MTSLPHPLDLRGSHCLSEPPASAYDAAFLLTEARIRRWLAMRLERFAREERDKGLLTDAGLDTALAAKLRADAEGFEGRAARVEVCSQPRVYKSAIHRQGLASMDLRKLARGKG